MTSVTSTAQRGLPNCIRRHYGGGGHRANIAITFGTEKLKMVVYHAGGERTKCDDMFSRVDTIRVCNTVKV